MSETDTRQLAIERLKAKRDFISHLIAFVMINGFLVAIWAFTSGGFFWPMFPIFIWGIGLVFHAWDSYGKPFPSEDDIEREMQRLHTA